MKMLWWILAVSVAALVATGAAAQVGGLKVAVRDSEGAPLPGARVTIGHALGYVKTTSELTDKQGFVNFPVLRPGGGYTIQISFPGFSPLRYDDIRVRPGVQEPGTDVVGEAVGIDRAVGQGAGPRGAALHRILVPGRWGSSRTGRGCPAGGFQAAAGPVDGGYGLATAL